MSMREYRWHLALGLLGIVAIVLAAFIDLHAFLVGYLAVVVTIAAVSVGALAVLLMTYLIRGAWTEGLHLPLTAAALTAPLAGIYFVPVLLSVWRLYPWAQHAGAEPGIFRSFYLTPAFFAVRTIVYFAIWTALAIAARRAWAVPSRMISISSAGLILYALTASLAGIDWLESLTPDFHSSIYGLLFLTFQLLAGLAFALVVALQRPEAPTFRYGAILLSVLLLWAYNHAMQYIIIWSGNIPEEVVWYAQREEGAWGLAFWALIVLQFIIPFFAMLSENLRNGRLPLLALAALTLMLRLLEALVLAAPGTGTSGAGLWLGVSGCVIVMGGLWWLAFAVLLRRLSSSERDTRRLPDSFDAAGSPLPAGKRS